MDWIHPNRAFELNRNKLGKKPLIPSDYSTIQAQLPIVMNETKLYSCKAYPPHIGKCESTKYHIAFVIHCEECHQHIRRSNASTLITSTAFGTKEISIDQYELGKNILVIEAGQSFQFTLESIVMALTIVHIWFICVKYKIIISNAMCYIILCMLEWMRKGKHRIGTLRTWRLRDLALTAYIHGGIP